MEPAVPLRLHQATPRLGRRLPAGRTGLEERERGFGLVGDEPDGDRRVGKSQAEAEQQVRGGHAGLRAGLVTPAKMRLPARRSRVPAAA